MVSELMKIQSVFVDPHVDWVKSLRYHGVHRRLLLQYCGDFVINFLGKIFSTFSAESEVAVQSRFVSPSA